MSEVVTAAPAPPVVRLPPAVRGPKLFQGLAFVVSRRRLLGRFVRRYGKAFTANILMYGRVVVVADPQLARQVFTSSPEELGNIQPNLSRMFGSGSVFALDGDDHRRRRRLLAPPFHGKSIRDHHRRGDPARDRQLAARTGFRNAAVNDAYHAQRHPACDLRGRRQ